MKKVLILGSTGSIGVNALNVIRNFPDKFKVEGLTANSNIELLERQYKEFNPSVLVVGNKVEAENLREN